jgi:hypothetical protein
VRTMSPRVKELFEALWKAVGMSHEQEAVEILDAIAACGESPALIPLAPHVYSSRERIGEAAARAASKLLEGLHASDYFWLDEGVRAITAEYRYYARPDAPHMPTGKVKLLFDFGKYSRAAFGLASFHANGYVREEAIHLLALLNDGGELPFLLLRLRDWVPEVQRTAAAAVKEHLARADAFQWARYLPLVYRLKNAQRLDHSAFAGEVEALLLSEPRGAALMKAMFLDDNAVRRLSLRLGMDHPGIGHKELITIALGDPDTTIRRMAARMVREKMNKPDKESLLPLMKENRSAAVRREALLLAVELGLGGADLEKALLDSQAAVRYLARFYLREAGMTDFAEFYRKSVGRGNRRIVGPALLGLGETGMEADRELIMPFLRDDDKALVKAAIRALDRLWPGGGEEVFLEALRAAHPGISRAARDALVKRLNAKTRRELPALLKGPHPLYMRINALYLMSRAERWESLACLLDSMRSDDAKIAEKSLHYVIRWVSRFNTSFTKPDHHSIEKIRSSIDKASAVLGEKLAGQIRYLTQGW